MKSKISIFALSFATVCMVSSCLGDNDTEYTYYDDTAITGITLGTLNIYGYKKASDGVTNSLYKKGTVTGGSLTIDQYNRTITNASDSLPVGTDLTKVLFSSITFKTRLRSVFSSARFKVRMASAQTSILLFSSMAKSLTR